MRENIISIEDISVIKIFISYIYLKIWKIIQLMYLIFTQVKH